MSKWTRRICLCFLAAVITGLGVTGCGEEMTVEDAAAEICVCLGNASSEDETEACMDESLPSRQIIEAYTEKITAEAAKEDPILEQVLVCAMSAAFKNMERK